MHVTLFGTGALGCLFGSRLAPVAEVTLVGSWTEALDSIGRRGILLEEGAGSRSVRVRTARLGEGVPAADLVLVLVKSWQTGTIAPCLGPALRKGGVVLTLQNGLGNLERLGPGAFAGSTTEGAALLGPGHVRAAGGGPTVVAAPQWVARLLGRAGFDARECDPREVQALLWAKLTASCGINALTALLGVPNGELLARPAAWDLVARAAHECARVAEAAGIRLPFEDAAEEARAVARRTASNRSSMLQDLERGAPTECDAIQGAVAAEGARRGVPTPVNGLLWLLVKAATEGKGNRCV
ncbi:MAG: ketopantoate reductase family protein [Acidobacteria bacterium]|nr:ketopantoate reductase family protein [Acidobacteriota bacterium]